jgi:glycosyltransferase involved in cell wall biosynthesis
MPKYILLHPRVANGVKIAIVADKLNVNQGGSNFSLALIADRLTNSGHQVTVVTVHFAHDNDLPEDHSYDVRPLPLERDSRIGKARAAATTLKELAPKFDVLHVFNPALLPSAGWYARGEPTTPIVGRLNTYDVFCTNLARMDGQCHHNCTVRRKFAHSERQPQSNIQRLPKYGFDTYAFPRLTNNLDRLFAISPQVEDVFTGIGVNPALVRVVPNFYDPAFATGDGRAESFEYERTALYAGALKEYKGVHLLVDALASLPDRCGVAFAGEGPARSALERRARDQGVEDRVTFCGWVGHDDLHRYYRGADAFVHPGLWPEPFGRTLLEAMQCGCPPVVSDVGAPPWVVDDAGLVFERNDPMGLASQLESVLTDSQEHAELQAACEERLEQFAPERTVSLIEEQYRDVTNSGRTPD